MDAALRRHRPCRAGPAGRRIGTGRAAAAGVMDTMVTRPWIRQAIGRWQAVRRDRRWDGQMTLTAVALLVLAVMLLVGPQPQFGCLMGCRRRPRAPADQQWPHFSR